MVIQPSLLSNSSPVNVERLIDSRSTLNDLTRQLASGKKSETYGGLGNDRLQSLGYREQIGKLDSYQGNIERTNIRLDVMGLAFERLEGVRVEGRDAIDPNTFVKLRDGRTSSQQQSEIYLDEAVALLNTQADGRYVLGGNDVSSPPVESVDVILNGDGVHAGLREVADERLKADLGRNGLGRLDTALAGTSINLSEDGAHDFGFDITNAVGNFTNGSVTFTDGDPAGVAVDFTDNPVFNEKITLTLALPDGDSEVVTLEAVSHPPKRGEFEIGADATETAANFKAALDNQLGFIANTVLTSASNLKSSQDFFNTEGGDAPKRVDASTGVDFPYDATATVDGTEGDTVYWYKGQNDTSNVRSAVQTKVDDSISVNYGFRANEAGLRGSIEALAAFALGDFNTGDEVVDKAKHTAAASRINESLADRVGANSIQSAVQEVAGFQAIAARAGERHTQTIGTLTSLSEDIEGVDTTEVAAKILTLQTQLEASYQTASILSDLSLVNYLR